MEIYCCGCEEKVEPVLISGREAYCHRYDLHSLPFWKCGKCGNFVGCHPGTEKALGIIATQEIKDARKHIHTILDPIWKSGRMKRKEIYAALSEKLGWKYHTANIRSVEEARQVYSLVKGLLTTNSV